MMRSTCPCGTAYHCHQPLFGEIVKTVVSTVVQHREIILDATLGCVGHAQLRNGKVTELVVDTARVVAELVHGVFITGLAQVESIDRAVVQHGPAGSVDIRRCAGDEQ